MVDGLSQSDTEFAECQQYYGYPCGKLIALLGRALAAEATADRYKVALERIVDGLDHDRYSESSRMYRSFGGSVPDDQCCPDCAACIATDAIDRVGTEPGEGTDVPPPSR